MIADTDTPLPMLSDLLERIAALDVDPRRIVLKPLPGTATEDDLIQLIDRHKHLYELVDGTLVEKCMGAPEANVAGWIIRLLGQFVDPANLGELFTADCPLFLMGGLIRLPDVTFIRRENLPNGQVPMVAVPAIAPDLAVEVLSKGNRPGEMLRKRKEYFLAGTTLVWEVDLRKRVVVVYTAPETGETFTETNTLDGGDVLPGLKLPVARIFERLPKPTPKRRAKK